MSKIIRNRCFSSQKRLSPFIASLPIVLLLEGFTPAPSPGVLHGSDTVGALFSAGTIEAIATGQSKLLSAQADIAMGPSLIAQVDEGNDIGAATLEITVNSNNVQISNFGKNAFQVTNIGDKAIAQIELDVTNALYPDTVFDPFGIAGDTASKPIAIDTDGGTGIIAPNNDANAPNNQTYVGTGGLAGFETIRLMFDSQVNNGFAPGETLGFSVDMDANSIAGAQKSTLDGGTVPKWDVGGVSGAELIGSTFTVTFTDGTTATGQLQGAGNQAGARAIAAQNTPNLTVMLTVNGLSPGTIGTYGENGPTVSINGPAGETARVVVTKGILQPVVNNFTGSYAVQLDQQLASLAASNFPANNAAEFQTVDVLLTGKNQDISDLFDFTQVPRFTLAIDEAQVPLGFVASVIDPAANDLPMGPVTEPIYMQFQAGGTPINTLPIAVDDTLVAANDSVLTGNVLVNNGNGSDSDADGEPLTVTAINGSPGEIGNQATLPSGALLTLNSDGAFAYDPNGQFETLSAGETAIETFTYTISDGQDTDMATVTVEIISIGDGNSLLEVGLYDADTDQLLQLIQENDTIQASTLPTQNLAIAALIADEATSLGSIGSVKLDLNNGQVTKVENVEPYALFGDVSGDFFGGSLPQGNHTIVFELYAQKGAKGPLLEAIAVSFTVVP